MDSHLKPARVVPPGRTLRLELETRGWTQKDLAAVLGRPVQAITEIVRGTKQITADTAVSLGAAFGTSAEFWSTLEANYRVGLAQQQASSTNDVSRKARLYDWVPVSELLKRGWVSPTTTVDELERAVCAFLGVAHVGEEPGLLANLRHSAQDDRERAAQRAWVRRVEHLALHQEVATFAPDRLASSVSALVSEAATLEGATRVPALLADLGVRFVVVPALPRTRVDGAAVFTTRGPVIALTMRFDRIDYFWFTLLHELAHIALEHRGGHLDSETEAGDISAEEAAANQRASEWLVSDEDVRAFAERRRGKLTLGELETFSREHRLHPGIVVGRLHHLQLVPFTHFQAKLAKVRALLEPWTDRVGA